MQILVVIEKNKETVKSLEEDQGNGSDLQHKYCPCKLRKEHK